MEAFYLKYRPQNLDDLIGQDLVKKTLSSAFASSKLSHAYLLVGPRGSGKTSTARILAKMVNCEKSTDYRLQSTAKTEVGGRRSEDIKIPCNQCSTCVSITDGSNLDLIEIDAASNRGIDDIRSLREKIKLSPSTARKKVYIIDEVHMLTAEAFNALLKTLEEPPSHALFILATTEVGKIPQTILSRVQRLDFKLATPQQLLEVLQKITKEEKIDIDEEGLKILIKSADGSFRDGVKLLDQVSSLEGKITSEVLEKFLKSSNFEKLFELVKDFSKKDTTNALTLVVKEIEDGVDIKEFILALMQFLRNLVFIKNDLGDQLVKENYPEQDYQNLIKVSESFTNQDLVKNLDSLQKALEKMKIASIPSLPLELAVVEICGEPESAKTSVIASEAKQSSLEEEPIKIASSPPAPRNDDKKEKPSEFTDLPATTDIPIPSDLSDTSNSDIQKLKEKWTFVLETIRPFNFSLEALLRSVNITQCTQTTLIIEVPYSFHQRILESPKNREILEGILSDILGRKIKISAILGVRPQRVEDIANLEVAKDDEIIRAAAEIFSSDTIN